MRWERDFSSLWGFCERGGGGFIGDGEGGAAVRFEAGVFGGVDERLADGMQTGSCIVHRSVSG